MEQPTGTVTFLFTDIEGSTLLWDRYRGGMPLALGRHDEIVRWAIAARGGYVFSTAGDSFTAAFARANDAVAAAVDAQCALGVEHWPIDTPLRVRMGLCTGEAQERDGNYFGPVLNRAARVMGTGRGGQILLSQSTMAVVEGFDLVDLGEHRLRDVSGVEHLFGVVAPGLLSEFPPLRTSVLVPNNLPSPVDLFVGRLEAVAGVVTALGSSRLVTLTGVGGTGKTRLALEAAVSVLEQFVDGVWLVELAPVSETAAVPFVVGGAVGATQQPGKSMLESLAGALAARSVLLVLDNCEHLLDEVAELVSVLESRCRGVRVLATSREGLGVRGEHLMPVGSLSASEGAELFAARAEDVGVTVAAADPGVARIAARLDGLPLAIELAAARTRGLSLAEIEQRLAERFRLLRGSRRGRVERHQTLWNTVAWSHQLLDPQERLVFDRLAVFAGGFTLEAATAVCAGDGVDGGEVEESILGLVERSMVLAEPTREGTRYRLLETLRQFGEAKLIDHDLIDRYRLRHARWYADFATAAADRACGVDGIEWCRWLLSEIDNYRAVVYSDDLVSARRIVAALSLFATASQSFEYIDWVSHVLGPPATADHDWIECALWGMMATHFVERADTRAHILSLLDGGAIPPDHLRYVWVWDQYTVALDRHEPLEPFLQPLFDAATTLENDWWRIVLTGQALLLTTLAGDLPLAGTLARLLDSDPARHTVPLAETVVSQGAGWYRRAIGDATALDCFERSRRVSAECGFSLLEQAAASQQVPLLIDAGDLEAARRQIRHAIAGQIRGGDQLTLWQSLHYLVRLLVEVGEHDTATEIWAELRDRGDWTETAMRAGLEAQLGPPGEPKLTDNQLITRIATLMAELD